MNGHSNSLDATTLEGAILVIDDELAIRNVLTDIFSFISEATVYTAANGHEGLRILQRQSIGLVMLDMNMPLMTGEETYERLRQIAPNVKVIISSSLNEAEAQLRFGERELPTYLQKPYDINTLIDVVQLVSATS